MSVIGGQLTSQRLQVLDDAASRLAAVALAARRAAERLQQEAAVVNARLASVQQELSRHMVEAAGQQEAGRLRLELRDLERRALAVLRAAEARLLAARASSHQVLAQHSDVQANLTAAEALATSAAHQGEVLRNQRDLAVRMEAYEEAEQLARTLRRLQGVEASSNSTAQLLSGLSAAHRDAVAAKLAELADCGRGLQVGAKLSSHFFMLLISGGQIKMTVKWTCRDYMSVRIVNALCL